MRPIIAVFACTLILSADPVRVRYPEGVTHGYTKMQNLDGNTLAWGQVTQTVRGNTVTSRLVFRYLDNSVHEATTVFTQRGTFRLVSDRVVQKGPAFTQPMETTVDVRAGTMTVRYTDKDGKEKVETEKLELPEDISNGLLFTILKDLPVGPQKTTVSMLAATPKSRLVKLDITPQGTEAFNIGTISAKATHYVIHVDLGAIKGTIANVIGKQSPDVHVWIATGTVPGFIKFEGPFVPDGPVVQIVLARPAVFKNQPTARRGTD